MSKPVYGDSVSLKKPSQYQDGMKPESDGVSLDDGYNKIDAGTYSISMSEQKDRVNINGKK